MVSNNFSLNTLKTLYTGNSNNLFKNAAQKKEIAGFPLNQDQFQQTNNSTISTIPNDFSSINSAPEQALDDFYAIANGGAKSVLDERIYGFLNGSFNDPSMSPVKGFLNESYTGIPEGNMLTDVKITPDIEFKKQLLESRIQYLLSYLIGLLEQGPDAISALIQRKGGNKEQADAEALRLVNEIQRKAPDFVASAQQAVKNARTRIAGMDQMAQANEKNSSALTKRVSDVIGKWGSGGG